MKKDGIGIWVARVLIFGGFALFLGAYVHWVNVSSARDREVIGAFQECITRVAHEQGYQGNTHGIEAWTLFHGSCSK